MKRIIIIIGILLLTQTGFSQEVKKSRKEARAEREAEKMAKIKSLLDSKNYVFNATHALPMGGSSIFLSSTFDLVVSGDSAIAYLPYYGVAYHAEYGGAGSGGIKFNEPLKEYTVENSNEGKLINMEVKTPKDVYYITLSVSLTGNANLHVNCNNRQPIQFFGSIEEKE